MQKEKKKKRLGRDDALSVGLVSENAGELCEGDADRVDGDEPRVEQHALTLSLRTHQQKEGIGVTGRRR